MSARAIAMRMVMKESEKCRSGRRRDRLVPTRPSGREGKKAKLLGDDERIADKHQRHMVVPPAPASTLEMIEAKLSLCILVEPLRAPALLEDAYHLLGADISWDRDQVELVRLRLALHPFDDEVLYRGVDADAAPREARTEGTRAALSPGHTPEGSARQRLAEIASRNRTLLPPPVELNDLRRRVDRDGIRHRQPRQVPAERGDVAERAVGKHDTQRNAIQLRALDHLQRHHPLLAMAKVVWNLRGPASRAIVGPGFRKEQVHLYRDMRRAARNRKAHRELTIGDLARRTRVLTLHAGRVLPLLEKPGIIDDRHLDIFAARLDRSERVTNSLEAHRAIVPFRLADEVQHPVVHVLHFRGIIGTCTQPSRDRLHALALPLRKQSLRIQ